MNATMERPVMARKRGGDERKMPADLRWGWRTVEELEALSKTLKIVLKNLDGSIAAAKQMGLDTLYLDGVTKGDRAVELLKGFTANVEHSYRREHFRDL